MLQKSSYLKIFIAYIIFSFWGPFMNKSSFTAFQNIFLISLFASIWLASIAMRNKSFPKLKKINFTSAILPLAIVSGVGGVVWLKTLTLVPVSQALFLFSSVPLFALAVEIFFLKQKLRSTSLLALAIGFLGIFIILSQGLFAEKINFVSFGSLLVLFSALMIALQAIFIRRIGSTYNFEFVMLIVVISQVIVSMPFAFQHLWNLNLQSVIVTLIMSLLAFVLAGYFYVDALKFINASTVRLIGYIEPVLGSLWGVVLLAQPLIGTTILGGLLILAASFVALQSSKKAET